jgi:hypothetical protein
VAAAMATAGGTAAGGAQTNGRLEALHRLASEAST